MSDPKTPRFDLPMSEQTEKGICVFCGSAPGRDPQYSEAARRVGAEIARSGHSLVYGGGSIGLMGVAADACLELGGKVLGVITEPLAQREIAHKGVSELLIVPDMHQRKALMARYSHAFLTLPGGIGTFEEFFEVFSWAVLGIHAKPLGILNVNGYYDPLLRLIDHAVAQGFVRAGNLDLLHVSTDPEAIVHEMTKTHPPVLAGPKWMNLDEA